MPLNETEKAVIITKVKGLSEKEALQDLEEKGFKMSRQTYYRILRRISAKTRKRLYEIVKNQKECQMQLIDEFNTIKKEQWKIYLNSNDENIKLRALRDLRDILPFITAAEAVVPYIIKEAIQNFGKDHEDQTHSSSTLDGTES